jgi:hypothetical protein
MSNSEKSMCMSFILLRFRGDYRAEYFVRISVTRVAMLLSEASSIVMVVLEPMTIFPDSSLFAEVFPLFSYSEA